jgi:O-antigen ligase
MNPKPASLAFQEVVLLALLALVPIVFSRVTQDCFEFPQTMLLATGALLLLWRGLASETTLAARSGPGEYLRAVRERFLSWAARDPLGAGVLLFLTSATASAIASPNPAQSLHGASDSTAGLVTAFSTASVYFASRSVARGHPAVLARFARAAGFASAVASGYALVQLAGLDPLVWGRTATYEGDVRIFGTLGHPNMLGAYLAMTVPLTVWLAIRAQGSGERVLWALVATTSAIVIAATLSRGAWIGLLAGGLAWAALSLLTRGRSRGAAGGPRGVRRSSRVPAAVLASLLAIAAAGLLFARTPMGSHLVERVRQITSLSAPTTQSRLSIWRAGLRMAGDHPWLGVGLDAFGMVFPRYRTAAYWRIEWARTPNKAHNEAIGIPATQGVVGGMAALIVVAGRARGLERGARRPEDPRERARSQWARSWCPSSRISRASRSWRSGARRRGLGLRFRGRDGGAARRGRTPRDRGAALGPFWWERRSPCSSSPRGLPVRAQITEKVAPARLPSPEAEALERAARLAPWDARIPGFLGTSLHPGEAGPTVARARTRPRAAEAQRSAIGSSRERV